VKEEESNEKGGNRRKYSKEIGIKNRETVVRSIRDSVGLKKNRSIRGSCTQKRDETRKRGGRVTRGEGAGGRGKKETIGRKQVINFGIRGERRSAKGEIQ